MNLLRKVVDGPIVVLAPERIAQGANNQVHVDAETRVLVVYPPQAILADMLFLSCDCPRVVQRDLTIKVWHSPECPELDLVG